MPVKTFRSISLGKVLGAACSFVGSSVWAGTPAVITYGPDSLAVPLLSDLTVLMLVALVAVLAYRGLRSGSAGRPLASIVAVGILVAGGGLSGRLESAAWALMAPVRNLTVPAGGTVDVTTFGVDVQIVNQTPVPQRIKSFQLSPADTVGNPTGAPKCEPASTVLPPTGSCYVFFIAG